MIGVLIADDQELIRESLKIVLGIHEDISVVGVAKDGYEVLQMLERQQVDVILMDIRMPGMDGVYCTKEVKNRYPKTRIIILTTFDDDEFVFGALKYGASGYLLKGVSMDELYNDIITVYQGGALINPDIANKVFSMFTRMNAQNLYIQVDEADAAQVSEAEWKVVRLVGYGLSNRENCTETLSFRRNCQKPAQFCSFQTESARSYTACDMGSTDRKDIKGF